jgi:hypothetical protein
MFRKLLIPFLALLLVLACFYFYVNLRQSKPVAVNALSAIPFDAAFILETKQLHDLFKRIEESNIIWEDLKVSSSFSTLRQNLYFLDSIFTSNPTLKQLGLSDHSLYISAHPSGNECNYLYCYALPDIRLTEKVEEYLSSAFQIRHLSDGVLSISTRDRKEVCYYSSYKGILLISSSEKLVRRAVEQSRSEKSVLNDKGFMAMLSTSKSSRFDLRLFYHFSKMNQWVLPFLDEKSASLLSASSPVGGWGSMDAVIKPKSILLNGLTAAVPDSTLLDLFHGQDPQRPEAIAVMPSSTASFFYEGFSNFNTYYLNYSARQSASTIARLDSLNKRYDTNFASVFSSWTENEVASLITEPGPGAMDLSGCTFVVLRSDKIEHTSRELESLCALVSKTDSLKNDSTREGTHPIRHLKVRGILPLLYGKPFSVQENYYTVLDNYLVFGNSPEALKNYLHFIDSDHTLVKDGHFNEFSANLSSKCNVYLYTNIARSRSIYQSFASQETTSDIRQYTDLLIRFEALGVQFSSQRDLFYTTAYLEENPIYKKETATLWETRLDTTFHMKPHLLLNHLTKTLDIFVQDDANKLYLISSTGRILWSRSLPEKIHGNVVQVDAFNNKKLQVLFNTRSAIYLIDRNGKDVDGFPVALPSPACNALTVVDYENKSDYRILIACADKHILNYTIRGKITEGWKSVETKDTVTATILHCVVAKKDYLITADIKGAITVLDRHGEARFALQQLLPRPLTAFSLDAGKDLAHTRLLAADSLGNIIRIALDGRTEHLTFKSFSTKPSFLFEDLNADHIPEFIFMDANELSVFTEDKSLLFSYVFSDTITQPPFCLTDPAGHRRIGVISESKDELYLLNESGALPEGFPLRGTTPFCMGDLNRDNTLQLISGEGKNIYAYTIP